MSSEGAASDAEMRRSSKRRPVFGLLLAALTGTAAAGLDLSDVKTRGTLRALVTSEEYVEWFALKDSESPGFERELLKSFAELQRMKLEVLVLEDFVRRDRMWRAGSARDPGRGRRL